MIGATSLIAPPAHEAGIMMQLHRLRLQIIVELKLQPLLEMRLTRTGSGALELQPVNIVATVIVLLLGELSQASMLIHCMVQTIPMVESGPQLFRLTARTVITIPIQSLPVPDRVQIVTPAMMITGSIGTVIGGNVING